MARKLQLQRVFKQIRDGIADNLLMVAFLIAGVIFLIILEDVVSGDVLKIDQWAYWFFVEKLRSTPVTTVMEGFSELGNPVVVLVMASLIAIFAPGRQPGRCVFCNLVCVIGINVILKSLVQRPRPDGFRLISESGYSFPSGHSMFSMAFFGLLIWMIWKYEREELRMRPIWIAGLSAIIVLVGLSRIYLGVHYASDVIAGFAISLIWLIFYCKIIAPIFMPDPDALSLSEHADTLSSAQHTRMPLSEHPDALSPAGGTSDAMRPSASNTPDTLSPSEGDKPTH